MKRYELHETEDAGGMSAPVRRRQIAYVCQRGRSLRRACALLAHDLVDAMSIFAVPVVLGGGKKLFADGSVPHSWKLARSRVSSNGLMIAHYERGGEIEVSGTELDSPSDRERARQERMKRER